MSDYSEAKTQFVRDRIIETPFHERRYIGHLLWLEDIMFRGGATGWAENVAYAPLKKDYPLEAEAIRRELREGNRTTTEEFRFLQEERRRGLQIEREWWRLFDERREREELQQWLRAGGLPDGGDRRLSTTATFRPALAR